MEPSFPDFEKIASQAISVHFWLQIILLLIFGAVAYWLYEYAKEMGKHFARLETLGESLRQLKASTEAVQAVQAEFASLQKHNEKLGELNAIAKTFPEFLEQQARLAQQNTEIQQKIIAVSAKIAEFYKSTLQTDLEFKKAVMRPRLNASCKQWRRLEPMAASSDGNLALEKRLLPRLNAYCELWRCLEPMAASGDGNLALEKREELRAALRSWYHVQSGGAMLSLKAFHAYIRVVRSLACEPYQPEPARKAVSSLRTQMKEDLGLYSHDEAQTPFEEESQNPAVSHSAAQSSAEHRIAGARSRVLLQIPDSSPHTGNRTANSKAVSRP